MKEFIIYAWFAGLITICILAVQKYRRRARKEKIDARLRSVIESCDAHERREA